MKKLSCVLILLIFQCTVFGQKLTLGSGGVGFTKGTINTDVLAEIIQSKQNEVEQRVFRNMIVKNFWKGDSTQLNNFTTQYLTYNLMKNLLEGKSKKGMTKNLMKTTLEFSQVYGFALYCMLKGNSIQEDFFKKTNYEIIEKAEKSEKKNNGKIITESKEFTPSERLFMTSKSYTYEYSSDVKSEKSEVKSKKSEYYICTVNDMAKVRSSEVNTNDIEWSSLEAKIEVDITKNNATANLNKIIDLAFDVMKDDTSFHFRRETQKETGTQEFKRWYAANSYTSKDTTGISKRKVEFEKLLEDFKKFKDEGNTAIELIKKIKPIINVDSQTGVDSISKEQVNALKYVLTEFADLAKNQFHNDIISKTIHYFVDNLQYEDKVMYVDVESLISQIYTGFIDKTNRGITIYVKPILGIGTNVLSNTGDGKSDTPVYLASEKLGFKFMLHNYKYTRSHEPGESFDYWGRKRVWLKPTKEPFISDIHVLTYVSGLLYNLANLRSTANFTQPFFGVGLGANFFNGLNLSVSYAKTFKPVEGYSPNFINVSVDIPLIEYITALRKK